jgi:hypothetical protein
VLSICFKRKKERWQISEERTKIYTMSETKIKMKSKEAQMIVTNFSGLNSKSMFYQYWKDDNEMIIEAWICKADELQNKLDNIKKLLQDARKDNL